MNNTKYLAQKQLDIEERICLQYSLLLQQDL